MMSSPPRRDSHEDFFAVDFFEMSLDHLCVTGFDGMFVRVNPAWTRTLGWTEDELLEMPTIDLVHPDDRAATLAARGRLHVGTPMGPLVNRYRCKDGSYRWFEWRSIGELDKQLVYAAARDITEQKRMEDSLRAAKEHEAQLERQLLFADRMASVGTLAAGAAHEINNPLTTVTANLQLLLEELAQLGATPQVDELIGMAGDARDAADTIAKVIRSLKTFARATVQQRSVFELDRVLELAISLTANEIQQRARLTRRFGPTPLLEGDETRLAQVFVNLLVNAAQAIPDTGRADHEIRIVTSMDDLGHAVIEVSDTGVGIPASSITRVFDPFFTTKDVGVGTGLGLSVCHGIVTAMGGTIEVRSEPGTGTTFRVVLPPAQAVAPSPPSRHEHAKGDVEISSATARGRVLVVDDDVEIGVSLRRVLRDHDVTAVASAQEALDRLEAGARYNLILSDVMMPGMSGVELYEVITRRFPELTSRIVFISGGAFTTGAMAFLERVPNERLEKPFTLRTLRALVARYTSGSRREAES